VVGVSREEIKMDMEKCKLRTKPEEKKCISISIKITPRMSAWLKEKEFSPTGIFYEAVKDLGFEETVEPVGVKNGEEPTEIND